MRYGIVENNKILNYINQLGLYSETLKTETIKKLENFSIDSIDEIKFDKWFRFNQSRIITAFNPGAYFVKAFAKELSAGTFEKGQLLTPVSHDEPDWMSDMNEVIRIAKTPWLDDDD